MEVDDDFYQLYIFILITKKQHDSAEFIYLSQKNVSMVCILLGAYKRLGVGVGKDRCSSYVR